MMITQMWGYSNFLSQCNTEILLFKTENYQEQSTLRGHTRTPGVLKSLKVGDIIYEQPLIVVQ